jgi:hypothetical protein
MASLPPASSKTGEWPHTTGERHGPENKKTPRLLKAWGSEMRTFDEGKEVR